MKFSVQWTKVASCDLEEIIDFIAEDSMETAMNIFTEIRNNCEKLTHFPKQGRIVPEFRRYHITIYREIIVTKWRIIYKVEQDAIFILAVIDSRRGFEDVLLSRLLK
ncbi:MAG: type II toxin-antitoxin system RelE/ParE family toxin [Fidelibacterota bacterium]